MIGRRSVPWFSLGLPGAGKSTLAEGLTQRFGARLVPREEIRAAMSRPCSFIDAGKSAAFSAVIAAVMTNCALGRLSIVEGMPFSRRGEYEAVAAGGRRAGRSATPILLKIEPVVAAERIAAEPSTQRRRLRIANEALPDVDGHLCAEVCALACLSSERSFGRASDTPAVVMETCCSVLAVLDNPRMEDRALFVCRAAGAAAWMTLVGRMLLGRVLLLKFRRDVRALNAGNYRPLLSGYAEDAVLRFNEGDHRWSGEHRGKAAIERFLRNFVDAGLQGEIRELFMAGPPWRLRLVARFDDYATGPDAEQIYRNRTVLVVRTRWGRIVDHEDFYEDTERIAVFDARLRELGIASVAAAADGSQ